MCLRNTTVCSTALIYKRVQNQLHSCTEACRRLCFATQIRQRCNTVHQQVEETFYSLNFTYILFLRCIKNGYLPILLYARRVFSLKCKKLHYIALAKIFERNALIVATHAMHCAVDHWLSIITIYLRQVMIRKRQKNTRHETIQH